MFEFFFDTARAIINLFLSGVITKCPDITFIMPHCGGCIAPLIDRFSAFAGLMQNPNIDASVDPAFVKDRFRNQFYFDMAGLSWPNQIKMILPYTNVERLLYGSDWPATPSAVVKGMAQAMYDGMLKEFESEEQRDAIYSGNAATLIERSLT